MLALLEIAARLPWKKIGIGIAGALILAFLAYPWLALSGAKKDRDKAIAEKADTVRQLTASRINEARAIQNREKVEAVADDLRSSFDELANATENLESILAVAHRSAREIAGARGELEALARSHSALVTRAEDLSVCETYELALMELGRAAPP